MNESHFLPEVPEVGSLVRITPIQGEPLRKGEYKFFCEESSVVSRYFIIDYDDRKYVKLFLNGELIREIQFDSSHQTWSTEFEKQTIQVEVEKILE